jgi:serine O-acetyltransferase
MTQKSLLHAVAAQIANGYETAEVPMYSEQLRMPDRKVIIKIIENLQKVFFPAYFAGGTVSHVSAETFAEFLLGEIYTDLCEQVHLAFSNTIKDEAELRERTSAVCDRFLCRLPQIQAMLMKDVAANFDGDPAAGSKEEVIFSYPGLYAIFVYRVAHELYESKVPLIPRIMSEYAHGATGIDINPGAQIGEYFFIDHGTGIVIGETTEIGENVKIYQGVTLGALSTRKGQQLKGVKRHPTIRDNVTIYSGTTILGGETVIGKGATIGGNAFIVNSITEGMKVSIKNPELQFSPDLSENNQDKYWYWMI